MELPIGGPTVRIVDEWVVEACAERRGLLRMPVLIRIENLPASQGRQAS